MSFEEKCSQYKSICLNDRQLCDFEMIINKGFNPLIGFMTEVDYINCLDNMRIGENSLWSIPITLCIDENDKKKLQEETHVVLTHKTGLPLGIMKLESIYKWDVKNESEKVFGVYDNNHPYIKILEKYKSENKHYNIGGEIIEWKKVPHYDFEQYRLDPHQVKEHIHNNNLKNVIGFQTRNPMHRSHYYLTKYAMDQVDDDNVGVLIHPVVGITQDCDVEYHTRVRCYIKLLKNYSNNNVKLCLLPLSMRMAGPREALWHAIIRKNYGCTHFVVGRDHAGPSYKKKNGESFFGPYDAHELVSKYKDEVEIEIITSKFIVYAIHKETGEGIYKSIDQIDNNKYDVQMISGTKQREMLNNNEKIPDWFTFPEIRTELEKSYVPKNKKGLCLYLYGLSGSGKTTIANYLITKMKEIQYRNITYLDGDVVRNHLSKGLTFSKEDRSTNVRRIGYVSMEVVKHGGISIVANIAPYEDDRQYNKNLISQYGHYVEIFVDTSLETCENRDVKGLYKLAREGKIKQFTGISDPFEIGNSDIVIKENNTIKENIELIIEYLKTNNLI